MRRLNRIVFLATAGLFLLDADASAANKTWAAGSGSWSVGANWNPTNAPASGDAIFLTSTDGASRTVINISDFARLAAKFNLPGDWNDGDFNYDGTANISDFALLAANFNQTLTSDLPRVSSVPEPFAIGCLSLCVLRRRRKF